MPIRMLAPQVNRDSETSLFVTTKLVAAALPAIKHLVGRIFARSFVLGGAVVAALFYFIFLNLDTVSATRYPSS
jgi:hypothetical protein